MKPNSMPFYLNANSNKIFILHLNITSSLQQENYFKFKKRIVF